MPSPIALEEWIRSPVECNVISYDSPLEDTPLDSTAGSHSRHYAARNCAQNAYSMLFIETTTTHPSFSNSSLRWPCRHERVRPVSNQPRDSDPQNAIIHHKLLDTVPNPAPISQSTNECMGNLPFAIFYAQELLSPARHHLTRQPNGLRYIKPGSSILSLMCCPTMVVRCFWHNLISFKWFEYIR